MSSDAMRSEHASGRLSDLSASTREKCGSEKQKHAKYGACEARDDQLARKAASGRELARFDHQEDGASSSGASSASSGEALKQQLSFVERLAEFVPGLGIILALMSSLFLGTAGMLVKLTTSVHGIQVAVLRNLIQLIVYSLIISLRGIGLKPAREELLPVAMRAVLGGSSITLSYCALKLIPLGDATTIRFSLPIWTLIMSYFFLRESCCLFKVSAVLICVAGVVLIARPDECIYLMHMIAYSLRLESDSEFVWHKQAYEQSRVIEMSHLLPADESLPVFASNTLHRNSSANSSSLEWPQVSVLVHNQEQSIAELLEGEQMPFEEPESESKLVGAGFSYDPLQQFEGCMTALAGSICLSVSVIALRMCQKTPAEIIIFWLSASSVLGGTAILLAINKWSLPNNLHDLCYVLLNGLCGAIGQWFMTSSLKVEQSGIVALARTFDIEIAFLYSSLLLGEQIRTTSVLGSICVMAGVVIVVIPRLFGSSASAGDQLGAANNTADNPQVAGLTSEGAGATIVDRSSYEQKLGATPAHHHKASQQHQTSAGTTPQAP